MYSEILSNLVINRIYTATTMYSDENAKNKRQNRPCWAVVIKYEGETVYTCGGKSCLSDINNLVILPKGCSYDWKCMKSGHFSIIEFDSECTHNDILCFPVKNGEKLLKLFKELEYKRTLKGPMYKAESIRDTYSIILALATSAEKKYYPSSKLERLSPAVSYIAKNYNINTTNDTLAGLTGLSTVYFRKLFTEVFGVSPIFYIHELRIKKAKEMLRSDFGSITDIAESLGYLNIYDFSRAFKKHVGMSPSQYEKNLHIKN